MLDHLIRVHDVERSVVERPRLLDVAGDARGSLAAARVPRGSSRISSPCTWSGGILQFAAHLDPSTRRRRTRRRGASQPGLGASDSRICSWYDASASPQRRSISRARDPPLAWHDVAGYAMARADASARGSRRPAARRRPCSSSSRSPSTASAPSAGRSSGGRDLDEYLYGYVQFLDWHPLLPWSMLFRTPVPGIVDGSALDVAGGLFAEPLMAVLFAGSVVAWGVAARAFGTRAAPARRGRAARLPGLRPDVPRALERAALRGGVRALGVARRAGRRGVPSPARSHSRAPASRCSR